ncbi:FecR domain-containing protein [Rhodocytophaga aerolata]|uniref:FecR domain-containing protein n=1 Tax=Rhodocytophaga aerolata TaxID=455078 RepID=A0ABT8RB77_9BACT|nr:FecR domain-containing protein [Rhodocytophaga aerolata]MDO1449354.1 FecR domain-containing protein [Rhodocytophaga aerolata]
MHYQYKHFSAEDFAADEHFQQWVLQPDDALDQYWEEYLMLHPMQKQAITEARQIIRSVKFASYELPEEDFQQIWHAIDQNTVQTARKRQPDSSEKVRTFYNWRSWQKMAAVLTLLIVATLVFFVINAYRKVEHQTAYGEIKTVQLPDGSTAILNANSTLRMSPNWSTDESREVWITGEAYFSVVHTANHQKFLVHVDESSTVEVLGTEFDVAKRRGKTKVMLASGKVKLNLKNEASLVMKPGELVEVVTTSNKYTKKTVDPATYASWKEHKLIFDGTPLSEVIILMEEIYGVQVEIREPSLVTHKMWGSMPTRDIHDFLSGISQSLDVSVTKTGNRVVIKNK